MKETVFILIYFIITPTLLFACPLCKTTIGTEVRAAIFDHDFLFNLFYMLLPFALFMLIAFALYHGPSSHRKKANASDGTL